MLGSFPLCVYVQEKDKEEVSWYYWAHSQRCVSNTKDEAELEN